jgi:hypothetical protein
MSADFIIMLCFMIPTGVVCFLLDMHKMHD